MHPPFLKWDEYLPDIVRDAVQLPNCRVGAFSKYAVYTKESGGIPPCSIAKGNGVPPFTGLRRTLHKNTSLRGLSQKAPDFER